MYKSLLSAVLLTTTLLSVNSKSFQFCVNESINYTEYGESVLVTSPGYPEQYNRSTSCTVNLVLSTDIPAVLHITQYIPTTAACSVPYTVVDAKGSIYLNQNKSCLQTDGLNIYTNVVPILSNEQPSARLILSVAAGLADGFNLTLTVTTYEAANTTATASSTVKSGAKTTSTSSGTWIAIGAGIGIFLLIVVVIILGFILGRRYNDRLSSKGRANMNAYEESDQSVENPNRFTSATENKILQVAVGAGSGIFLLIVVAIILSCMLGKRYNDRLSSKKRPSMNAYEESDQNDGDQTRPIPGRVGVYPFNQYSEVDLSCYARRNLQERMVESVEPIPDPANYYFTIEEPDGACRAGTGTPCTDSLVRYADNDQMPMSTFSGGATSPAGMELNPYSDADEPKISTNLRFPVKTRPDPANQYSDIDLSPAPANEMEDTNHYWEIERTNDGQTNTLSDPHQTAEVTRTTARNVYHDVEPSASSERQFRVDEEPGTSSEEPDTSSEEPATEGNQRAPVYSMIRKNPVMVDNSLYEAN